MSWLFFLGAPVYVDAYRRRRFTVWHLLVAIGLYALALQGSPALAAVAWISLLVLALVR
jgi:hypothetical protein